MLQTKMAPSSAELRPYVWAYGMTTGRVDAAPLVIPLPARPKQLLTFSFADRFRALRIGSAQSDSTPRVAAVGPQSCTRPGLSVFGRIDNFTIHFQPSGFNRLFGVPMTELTDTAHDAHAVIGPEISSLELELGDTPGFAERIQIIEKRLIPLARIQSHPDAVAIAANRLFASHGIQRVSAMATASGLSTRQFERRFLAQVGVPPKLYAESSGSTPSWITSSGFPADRGAASPTIMTTTIRCISCTTVVTSRESPLHGSSRSSAACPRFIRSSRLLTARAMIDSLPSVAFLLYGQAANHLAIVSVPPLLENAS